MSSSDEPNSPVTWPPLPGPSAVVRGQGVNTSERETGVRRVVGVPLESDPEVLERLYGVIP